MPPKLDAVWHTHGYYGSVSHNVKAIYQRYLGWYDANPAHLWQHPPQAAAERYARLVGGADQLAAKAREFFNEGDLRFAAELGAMPFSLTPTPRRPETFSPTRSNDWVTAPRTPHGATAT